MFTGIIEQTGEVVAAGNGALRIRAKLPARIGDSVAVNGAMLRTCGVPMRYRPASAAGWNAGAISNCRAGSQPNHPASPGSRSRSRGWTYNQPTEPGPP